MSGLSRESDMNELDRKGCNRKLAPGQYWGFCGETDMGQTLPALCVDCYEALPDEKKSLYLRGYKLAEISYVGQDFQCGLECTGGCRKLTYIWYSELLEMVARHEFVDCVHCCRQMAHSWETIRQVQRIIEERKYEQSQTQSKRRT